MATRIPRDKRPDQTSDHVEDCGQEDNRDNPRQDSGRPKPTVSGRIYQEPYGAGDKHKTHNDQANTAQACARAEPDLNTIRSHQDLTAVSAPSLPLPEIRHRRPEDQTNQALCLNLVTNAVIFWNTVYITAAIDQLRYDGKITSDDDLSRLSPTIRDHINPYGRYTFDLEQPNTSLRPLRQPEQLFAP